jgi:hypothetical protein
LKRLVLIVLGALFFASAMATAGHAAEEFATQRVPRNLVGAAANYWTKERMMRAKPCPMPAPIGEPIPLASGMQEQPTGTPGFDPCSKGDDGPDLSSEDEAEAFASFEASSRTYDSGEPRVTGMSNGYAYPPPQNTFKVLPSLYGTTSSTFPYRAVGKVFFTEGGLDYVCSGSAIGGRAVLTAGHCVSDGNGHFHTNWIFVPSYKDNTGPYGPWSAFWLGTFPAWHNNGNLGRDVGFAAVTDQGGVKLSAKVGHLGFAWNESRVQHWNDFGYPQVPPWDGQYLVETQASYASTDTSMTPNTTGIGTSQTPGCSGGPWIKAFMPGGSAAGNYANGVNSYAHAIPNQPNQVYSPYFDGSVKSLKDKAAAK